MKIRFLLISFCLFFSGTSVYPDDFRGYSNSAPKLDFYMSVEYERFFHPEFYYYSKFYYNGTVFDSFVTETPPGRALKLNVGLAIKLSPIFVLDLQISHHGLFDPEGANLQASLIDFLPRLGVDLGLFSLKIGWNFQIPIGLSAEPNLRSAEQGFSSQSGYFFKNPNVFGYFHASLNFPILRYGKYSICPIGVNLKLLPDDLRGLKYKAQVSQIFVPLFNLEFLRSSISF